MAFELISPIVNYLASLYHASQQPAASASRPALTPDQRHQAIVEAARQKVADERNRKSVIPLGVRDVSSSIISGINNGTYGIPARVSSMITGTPNDLLQEYMDQEGQRAPITNILASLAEGLATGSTEAKGLGLAGKLVGSVAPKVGKIIQGAAQLKKGQKLLNTAKIIGAGAAAGATDAAVRDRDVAQGAEIGGIAAPVAHLGLSGAGAAFQKGRDLLGLAPVSKILTQYVKTPIADIQAAMNARAQQGLPSSIYEVLPLADRESLKDAIGKMPAGTRERLDTALSQRANEIVGETATRVRQLTRPAVNPVRSELASDLASSRNAEQPTIAEKRAAVAAVKDPTDMNAVMRQEAHNIMAPHDDKVVYGSVDELAPKHLDLTPEGGLQEVHSNPEITSAIRDAAGKLKYRNLAEGITVGDVTGILSNLAKDATAADPVKARNARDAAEAVMDSLQNDHPDVADDVARMRGQWRKRIEMVDSMREGYQSRTRQQAGMKGVDAQDVRTAYDTPQGAQGRALGQAVNLDESLLTSPQKALGAMNEIDADPTAQKAISNNLGGTAGEDVANVARMQSQSVRNLGSAQTRGGDEHDVEQTLQNLAMAALPQTMMHTKAIAISRLVKAMRIPEKQGNQIVDMLFSADPKKIAVATGILKQAGAPGQQVMRSITQDLAVGNTAASTYQGAIAPDDAPPEEASQPGTPDYSKMSNEELLKLAGQKMQPTSTETPDISSMSDEDLQKIAGQQPDAQPSPYAGHVENSYSPEFQQLFDRMLHQESGHQQMDAQGNPVQSPVGAVGIAQVMPTTAPKAAKLAGLPWDEHAYYTDPDYNKALGAAYLDSLLQMFKGNPALAVAAYNAGPGRVKKAIVKGQSRWAEFLPSETKDYLQAILQ